MPFFKFSNPFLVYDGHFRHRLKSGDLIEIDRGKYKHWAICESIDKNGNIWCFHVTHVPLKMINEKVSNKMRACIIYETLPDILRAKQRLFLSKCRVNNQENFAKKLIKRKGIEEPDLKIIFNELHIKKNGIFDYDPKV